MGKLKTLLRLTKRIKNWQLFLYDYSFSQKKNPDKFFLYKLWNGTKIYAKAFTDDKWAISEVFIDDIYWHKDFNPFSDEPIIIDLGAHIGCFALDAANRYPRAKIYALEPADTLRTLQKNIKINGLDNIIPLKSAIAQNIGEDILYVNPKRSICNSLIQTKENKSGKVQKVKKITLKKLIQDYNLNHIDLVKCDVEGSEFEFVPRLTGDILRRISNITMEYHLLNKSHQADDLVNFLEGQNFELLKKQKNSKEGDILKFRNKGYVE